MYVMPMDYSLLIILGYRVKKEKKMVWRGHFAKNWSRGGISLKIALEGVFGWRGFFKRGGGISNLEDTVK